MILIYYRVGYDIFFFEMFLKLWYICLINRFWKFYVIYILIYLGLILDVLKYVIVL